MKPKTTNEMNVTGKPSITTPLDQRLDAIHAQIDAAFNTHRIKNLEISDNYNASNQGFIEREIKMTIFELK